MDSERRRAKSNKRGGTGSVEGKSVLLYEANARISGHDYFVEITRNKVAMLVTAFSIVKAETKEMRVPIKTAYRLIQECGNQFERLVDKLQVKYGTLLLKEPKVRKCRAKEVSARQSESTD